MRNVNWDDVQETTSRPVPGGYIAKIVNVEDDEQKEYIKVFWDFAEGDFKDSNRETYESYGFWPMQMICSYKKKALPFFKGFKTAVEMSNRNYVFKNDPESLIGKFVGVVLGEEEYQGNDGKIKTRLYVAEKRSGKVIRDGDYRIPELKKLAVAAAPTYDTSYVNDDDDFPF